MEAYTINPAAAGVAKGTQDIPVRIEAGRLLDDIKYALDVDLDYATAISRKLACLLAENKSTSMRADTRPGLAVWQRRKIERFIDQNLETSIAIDDLARLVSLSYSYFSRAFKDSFGLPPHAYVIKKRVDRAKTLVNATSESLSQIALLCGFADQAHFCRRFREHVGITPAAWRRLRFSPLAELPDQQAGALDVHGVETFREPAVDIGKQRERLPRPAVGFPDPGQADGGAQFP